jgi:flavin reductase (DIM6/NTAB) family NADH-FMN oxidoreductase RutF
VVPRPTAFSSTIGEDLVYNVAPFSCFTPASIKTAHVCFGIGLRRDGRKKDTLKNMGFSGDFVVNVANES